MFICTNKKEAEYCSRETRFLLSKTMFEASSIHVTYRWFLRNTNKIPEKLKILHSLTSCFGLKRRKIDEFLFDINHCSIVVKVENYRMQMPKLIE